MTTCRVEDREFVAALRGAVEQYFAAVDQWESAFRRYYRMPDENKASHDLGDEQREYDLRRRELEGMTARARGLCMRYGRRDVFGGLTYIRLGRYSPQQRTDSAIGRAERNAVMECLLELAEACQDWPGEPATPIVAPRAPRTSILARIAGFFW
jgi:hypothetical protein